MQLFVFLFLIHIFLREESIFKNQFHLYDTAPDLGLDCFPWFSWDIVYYLVNYMALIVV